MHGLHAGVGDRLAWLIASADLPTDRLRPPARGRAPGWDAGLALAQTGSSTNM